jgi:diguanylate cyclase (GGDEF)-like protein
VVSSGVLAWIASALVCGAATVACTVAAGLAWRRRRTTATARALAVLMSATGGWCLTDLVIALVGLRVLPETAASLALGCVIPLIAVLTASFWVLGKVVADRDWRPSRRVLAGLSVNPLLLVVAVGVNPVTGWLYTAGRIGPGQLWLAWTPSPLYWVQALYSYALLIWGGVVLIPAFRHGSQLQRRQVGRLLLFLLVPLPLNLIATFTPPGAVPDLTAIGFAVGGVAVGEALLRHGLAVLVPVARSQVLEMLRDAVIVLDADGRVLDINRAGDGLLRSLAPDLPEDLSGVAIAGALGHGQPDVAGLLSDGEHLVEVPAGQVALDVRTEHLTDARGTAIGLVVVIRDVTELVRLRDHLAEQALRDELTGVHNRRALMTTLERELATAVRSGHHLSVIMLDLDHFKSVNDEHGHAVGDALLAAAARALAQHVRATDLLARMGGEEFLVLLPNVGPEAALSRAQELRKTCADVVVDGVTGPVRRTMSVGVASLASLAARDGVSRVTAASLLRAADEAMYHAKESGRNRVVVAA